eukprot:5464058-Ditylum_brightwellii.AAC.1
MRNHLNIAGGFDNSIREKIFVTKIPANSRLDFDWPLDEDLGLWTVAHPLILRDTYYEHASGTIYVCSTNGCFTQHTRVEGHMSTYTPMTHQLPAPPSTATFTPIHQFQEQQLLGNLSQQEMDTDFWVSVLQADTVILGSDGLVKEGCGTYAVVFQSGKKEIRFQGPVNCHPSLILAYCAELTDILVIYHLLKCMTEYSKESFEIEVTAHVDNSTAVNANNQDHNYPGITSHTAPDIDLLMEINALKSEQLQMTTKWVEAHQDTKYPGRPLSAPAKLNCVADADASKYMASDFVGDHTPPILSTAAAILMVNGTVVTSKMQE